MSQSPISSGPLAQDADYYRNWNALGELIKRGSSFSGRERNCVFLNTGELRFANVSAVTQLDLLDDGRGVALTDWDFDGDVDIWMANRTAPRLRLKRNDLPHHHRYLSLRLRGSTSNRDAIGARLEIQTAQTAGANPGRQAVTVRAGDGFLTQSTKWIHFGVGQAQEVQRLRVRWPGATDWEEFGVLETNARYRLQQGSGVAVRFEQPAVATPLAASQPALPEPTEKARVVLTKRVPLPISTYRDFGQEVHALREGHDGPILVNLWASWCQPCLQELRDFAQRRQAIQNAGIKILPLCTDDVSASGGSGSPAAAELLPAMGLDAGGIATAEDVAALTELQSWIFYRHRPLPLPSSFLLDADGNVAVIYRGPTTADQVLKDDELLEASGSRIAEAAHPGRGEFVLPEAGFSPVAVARTYRESGYLADARSELLETLDQAKAASESESEKFTDSRVRQFLVSVYRELSLVEAQLGNPNRVVEASRAAAELDPDNPSLKIALAVAFANKGSKTQAAKQLDEVARLAPADVEVQHAVAQAWLSMREPVPAAECLLRAAELAPENTRVLFDLGVALQLQGKGREASAQFEKLLALDETSVHAANNLAWIYATDPDPEIRDGRRAVELAERACQLVPQPRPTFLGTLGAAYATAGDFDKAVETLHHALRLAEDQGATALARDLQRRLRLHEQGLPYHRERTRAVADPD